MLKTAFKVLCALMASHVYADVVEPESNYRIRSNLSDKSKSTRNAFALLRFQ